ncbi:MAG: hypothetical protein IIZ80_05175 [Erysipelotrichaceae bacterium]|nr:hypothetical protein [Erysipelotrichaceae bacterium]
MDVSKEQRLLKVFAIISLIFGIVSFLFGVLMIAGGGIAIGNVENITTDTTASAEEVAEFSALFIVGGLVTIFSGITSIIDWAFLKRVAADATKYKPAWVVSIVSVVLGCLSVIASIANHSEPKDLVGNIIALVINVFIFYLVNKVKKSVVA